MEDQTVSGQEKVGQEEEDDYNPGIKAGSGARKNICVKIDDSLVGQLTYIAVFLNMSHCQMLGKVESGLPAKI